MRAQSRGTHRRPGSVDAHGKGTLMNNFIFPTVAGIALAAPATAAPSGSGSAQDTVNLLPPNGYRVILNKIGGKPLHQCTVQEVRPGQVATPSPPVAARLPRRSNTRRCT